MNSQKDVLIITGSSGLIGYRAVNRLAELFRVIGFDNGGPTHPPPTAECVCVDVTSDESVRKGLERVRYAYGEQIASVIHLAAYHSVFTLGEILSLRKLPGRPGAGQQRQPLAESWRFSDLLQSDYQIPHHDEH